MNEHALKIFPLYAIASFDVFSYPKKKSFDVFFVS